MSFGILLFFQLGLSQFPRMKKRGFTRLPYAFTKFVYYRFQRVISFFPQVPKPSG